MRSRYLTSTAVFYVVVIGFSLLLFCFHRAVYRQARAECSLFVADSHQVFYPLSPVCRPLLSTARVLLVALVNTSADHGAADFKYYSCAVKSEYSS